MSKNDSTQKTSKKYHKPNQKISWLDKVKLWFLLHSKIAFLLDSSIFFLISFWDNLFVAWDNSCSKTISKPQLWLSTFYESCILSASLIILISQHIDNKKREEENGENQLK